MTGRSVLQVIEALTVGGAEQVVVTLAQGFADRKSQVLCLREKGSLAQDLPPETVRALGKSRTLDLTMMRNLREAIEKDRPSAIVSHLWTANLWSRIVLGGLGIPLVCVEHSCDTWKPFYYRWLDRMLAGRMSALVAVSEGVADFYRPLVGSSPIHVIRNGIDVARYQAGNGATLRESLGIAQDALVIGTVGRLIKAKNTARFVTACQKILSQCDDCVALVVGDGPERGRLEELIAASGCGDRIHLLGRRQDVADCLTAMDLFVLTSDREGYPLTALEAQVAGCAVVLTDAGGAREALAREGEQAGGVIAAPDTDAVVTAIQSMISNPERRKTMARFGAAYGARQFGRELMVKRYQTLLDDLIVQ